MTRIAPPTHISGQTDTAVLQIVTAAVSKCQPAWDVNEKAIYRSRFPLSPHAAPGSSVSPLPLSSSWRLWRAPASSHASYA